MVGNRGFRHLRRQAARQWLRPVVIVLFFILVAVVSTSPASVTEPAATSLERREMPGPG
jgi:hypothetical protein